MKLILAAAFALLAAPAFADDPMSTTCKDMMAMDATGMMDTAMTMKKMMPADAKVMAMSDADVTKAAGDACTAYPDGTVMAAMGMMMASATTCADMMMMDEAGMANAGMAMKMAMMDDAKMSAMADADVTKMAGEACTAHPDGTVMAAVSMMMASTMTCKDLMAQDMDGMMHTGMAMKMAMMDDAKMSAMADADVTKMAEEACTAHPDATVMDAMKM